MNNKELKRTSSIRIRDRILTYLYCIFVISYNVIRFYIKLFENNHLLNYKIRDLFIINIGDLINSVVLCIFPVFIMIVMFNIYVRYKKHKKFGRLFAKSLKIKIAVSVFVMFFVLVLFDRYGFDKNINTFLYVALSSFISVFLILSSFLSIAKDLMPGFYINRLNQNKSHNNKTK